MRMGMVIGVQPERVTEYKALHAAPWPEMDAALKAANIHDYSIFLKSRKICRPGFGITREAIMKAT
jgi:L-rhamnose mutarotase